MTDTTDIDTATDSGADQQLHRPGAYLRSQREAAGMSQVQVGESLHLTLHYIRALESDEYGKLPGLTFVKGYFRSYARLLKVDEQEVLEYYDRHVATLNFPEAPPPQLLGGQRRGDQSIVWALVAGVLLVAAVGAGWWFYERGVTDTTPSVISLPQRSQQNMAQESAAQAPVLQSAPAPVAAPVVAESASPVDDVVAGASDDAGGMPDQTEAEAAASSLVADALAEAGEVPADDLVPTDDLLQADEDLPADDTVQADDPVPTDDSPALPPGQPAAVDSAADATMPDDEPAPAAGAEPDTVPSDDEAAVEPLGDGAVLDAPSGSRRIALAGNGSDRLELEFTGSSWVEVDDATLMRLYSGLMGGGDLLSIRATAPFHVLFGNAHVVAVELNDAPLALRSSIRSDNTARIRISAEGVSPWEVQ